VGVGIGRYADVALRAGAEVWGIDLSYSVEAAQANLGHNPGFHAVQANLFDLPFAPESFDVIYSFGVLHHTPDPAKAFAGLIKFLKPGGMIIVTLYSIHEIYHTSRHFRKLTTKLPSPILYGLTTLMTLLLYFPYRYLRLSNSLVGHYLPISTSPSLKEAILDTFDCYSPTYQFTFSEYQVFSLFKECGLRDIEVRPQPVTMLGYR
jgi:SAM-dependent methyltransferase